MASINVKLRPSTTDGKEGTIYYQIIHNRVIRQQKTDYHLFTHEWNEKRSTVIIEGNRSNYLQTVKERIEWDMRRWQSIIRQYENKRYKYHADDIIATFQKTLTDQTLFNFMQSVIARLQLIGKERTAYT